MITLEEEQYILDRAYVPEHIVSLMALLSKGEPFLIEDFLCLVKDNWLIVVGYPIDGNFFQERCDGILRQVLEKFHPEYLWFIGPEIPPFLLTHCQEREIDRYYRLDLGQMKLKSSLQRIVDKASKELTVEEGQSISRKHEALISELLKREKLSPRVRELYRAMSHYVPHSSSSCVLNAWDKNGNLCAFYVVELGAKNFSSYILGTHSKKNYISHASDLLFFEMIELTRRKGKNSIQLGLGVNEGIRRFKEKWGGTPFLQYEFCECFFGTPKTLSMFNNLAEKL
jgi:hypothetical protein